MHLEKLFQIYLEQAKKQVLTLRDNDRTRACQWIKKIELVPNPDEQLKNLQLHSIKLLLLSLESNYLIGPFEESPVDDREFTKFNWESYELNDFSNMIRLKRDTRKPPQVSYAVSGNRRELVTYQDDPATGQHCYYACSKEPIEEWTNLQGDVIENKSIDQWKEHGEFEELNHKEFEDLSPDIPRCAVHTHNSGVDFNLNDDRYSERNPSRCQRIQNSSNNSNCANSGTPRSTNYQLIHTGRPETPQRFGGMGRQTRAYEIEQFGLSQNEQFRSPRGVFQNLDYDRIQTHRSPMPPRLTDEVIESFENARHRRVPLSEVKPNDARQKLRARLQTIRDGMNKKPQLEIEHQIEIEEPEMIPYERIELEEPCEDICGHEETEQDLGILSLGDMDDDALFGDQQTIDPMTIFKTKDENLVCRNVKKIQTNTTINGNKREVTEEVLEQEDVNVVDRNEEEDENLVDVSEPTFQSLTGQSSYLDDQNNKKYEQWKSKPRRVLADYSDLPQEDLADISKPSFQQTSSFQDQLGEKLPYNPREESRFYSGRQQDPSHNENLMNERKPTTGYERLDQVCQPDFATSVKESTTKLPTQVDISERLEDICQPGYASSLEDSISRSLREHKNIRSINQISSQQVDQSGRFMRTEPSSYVNDSERFNNVCQADCAIASGLRRDMSPHRGLSHVEASERLDEVSQPSFLHSTEVSYQGPTRKDRCLTNQKLLPRVETSKRLDQVSHPEFLSSIEDTYQDSKKRSESPLRQKAVPQVNTSERLDQISQPSFVTSFQESNVTSRRGRDEILERLDEVSQPECLHFSDSISRTSCQRSRRPMPQMETSEMLDQVSHPEFSTSIEDTYRDSTKRSRCLLSQKAVPEFDTSERLEHISHPSFATSFEDSKVSSRRGRCVSPQRYLPQVETSENLEEVSEPRFLHCKESSYQCPKSQRPLHQEETSERLDHVSQPVFLSSIEESYQDSIEKNKSPSRQRGMPQVEESERLDQVSHPVFLSSIEDTHQDSTRRTRCSSRQRYMPQVDRSDRLDQISHPTFMTSFQESTVPSRRRRVETSERLDEVSQPTCLHSTDLSHQDPLNRNRWTSVSILRQKPLPQVKTSERLDQVSHHEWSSSLEDTYQGSSRRSRQRSMPKVDTSERLDQISHPSFATSFQNSSVTSRRCRCSFPCRRFLQTETSEKLEEVSQPRFSHSPEILCQEPTRRTRCQRPLPQEETSERLEEVSHPGFLSSIEDRYEDSKKRDSSKKSGGTRRVSICRTRHEVQTIKHKDQISHSLNNSKNSELLDEVCQPNFQSSYEDSSFRSRVNRQRLVPGKWPHVEESQRLNDVCRPEYSTSFQTSSTQNTGINKKTPTKKQYLPVDDSEILENICQPEFPSSFEDNLQRSMGQGKHTFPQNNVSERLVDISQPFYSSSFEDSIHRSRENKQGSMQCLQENSKNLNQVCQRDLLLKEVRLLPQIDESENLEAVIQPELTSFEDTGYGSKDSLQTVSQRPLPPIEDLENLEDISQPNFQSSYEDSILRTRENRCTQDRRFLPFVNTSERLDDVCQPDIPTSFDISISSGHSTGYRQNIPLLESMDSEKLENVCQPSFESSFKDSNRGPKLTPHSEFKSSIQESVKISRKSKQDPRQRLFSTVNTSEILDDISQPIYLPSFEDQRDKYALLQNEESKDLKDDIQCHPTSHRPLPQVSESEHLDNVTEPVFRSSLEAAVRTSQRRPQKKIDTSEKLSDVRQPLFPTSFEDSIPKSERYTETPKRRPLPVIDISEKIEDVCQPSFGSSFEESSNKSRTREKLSMQRPFPQVQESERLDDVSQPSVFPSSIKHSTAVSRGSRFYPSHVNDSGKPSFEKSKQMTVIHGQFADNRPFAQIDRSERLNDISQPDFGTSLDSNVPRSRCPSKQTPFNQSEFSKQQSVRRSHPRQQRYHEMDISERLDDVCQPSFPNSLEDSRSYSRRNQSRPNQEYFPREMQQKIHHSEVSSSSDRSDRNSKRLPSDMLEDCTQPEFHSTFQDSTNVSSERRRTGLERKPMPQIDLSENIESVCQPDFPVSFEDSTRNDTQNASSTYRKNNNYVTNFPKENLADISAPTFHSNYESSMQRGPANFYLTQENLEDISSPSFQTTPKLQQRRCREDIQCRAPPRQLFPKQDLTRDRLDRPGDFRKVFESMPNYAPFEQQIASKRIPIASRLKLPVTFDYTMTQMAYPRPQTQPSQYDEMKTRPFAVPLNKHNTLPKEDFRGRPPIKSQANPCTLNIPTNRNQLESRPRSLTRIPLPPSARSQTKIEKPSNQERLVKKSSVKFHQTKSTYFKNKQDKSSENQSRR